MIYQDKRLYTVSDHRYMVSKFIIPSLLIEAALAMVRTTADEQRHPHPCTVCYINRLYFSVIHNFTLQVQYPCLYFFGLADIPEVFAEISACAACNAHLCAVGVSTARALPLILVIYYYLSVKATARAVIALGVKLCILNIVIDKLDNLGKCGKIICNIGYLDIAYSSAAGYFLELRLEGELLKSVDFSLTSTWYEFV